MARTQYFASCKDVSNMALLVRDDPNELYQVDVLRWDTNKGLTRHRDLGWKVRCGQRGPGVRSIGSRNDPVLGRKDGRVESV